jgi:phosphatidate cytidylyltransferase
MLRQRILTALVMAPVAIGCLFFLPPIGFAIFVGLVLTIGAWEWANFAGIGSVGRYVYGAFVGCLLLVTYFLPGQYILILGCLWWIASFFFMTRYPAATELWSGPVGVSIIGLFVLVPGFVALLTLKALDHANFLILLLFFLIWGADIGAYFTGRALGKHKLAPAVSPGKTWEGFFGGLLIAFCIGIGMLVWQGYPALSDASSWVFLGGLIVVIMVSVLGDLVMSMFKRNRGVKDSSNLLPGHGGILDRIDSLLSAGPVFALLVSMTGFY